MDMATNVCCGSGSSCVDQTGTQRSAYLASISPVLELKVCQMTPGQPCDVFFALLPTHMFVLALVSLEICLLSTQLWNILTFRKLMVSVHSLSVREKPETDKDG